VTEKTSIKKLKKIPWKKELWKAEAMLMYAALPR
jgi:hypothetical protein